jgi:beta-glucosidase
VKTIAIAISAGLLCLASGCQPTANTTPVPESRVDQKVDDLLARMTLREEIEQLRCISSADRKLTTRGDFDESKAQKLLADGMGEIAPIDFDAEKEVALRNAIQSYLVTKTRLGIPAIFHNEACHGFLTSGATSFPAPIGMACSWDPDLYRRVYSVVAEEMRARGVSQALAPVVDICREPRWGRTDETMGEDPYLNGNLAAAVVCGLQGDDTGDIAPGHVAATLKHLAGHGQPEGGINRSPGDIPLRQMYDAHLVPFRIAIAQAHPAAVMASYNEVNSVPSHANHWLLHDVLRTEFGFGGLIVSDYTGVEYLSDVHHVAADHADAALKAFQAGVEVNLPDGVAFENLEQLVAEGRISRGAIDEAVRHVLRLKFALGLFDHPYGDAAKAIELAHLDSSKALARQAARESIVLLKNRDGLLPLPKGKYRTIAVIGPNAADARLGSYSGDPLYKVSILDGVRSKVGNDSRVLYAEGCKIVTNLPESSMAAWHGSQMAKWPTEEENKAAIADAVSVARRADVILLVLGENEMITREAWAATHLGDRASLDLPGAQNDLARAMFALGKPVVVYLMNGRPLSTPLLAEKADALLEGWYMGQETGNAAADLLFGDASPSGKLTITIPRSVGQLPMYYDHQPGARLFNYVDESDQPLYPFGFGLSYTTFAYSDPQLSAPTMPTTGQVALSVTVTNTGAMTGDEIVQFYIHQMVSSVTRPVEELKGFQRITLNPGQQQVVTFNVDKSTLAFHGLDMNYAVEPADFELMVGPSSAELKKITLRVTE